MEVAVLGSGIAGMSSGYFLTRFGGARVRVSVFEASESLGGHSLSVETQSGAVLVDMGFQVFNRETYPNLTRLYEQLRVKIALSTMSFCIEYAPDRKENSAAFSVKHSADISHYLRWACSSPIQFASFVRDKVRFHRDAAAVLAQPDLNGPQTIAEFFRSYGDAFVKGWIEPFARAVWSLDAGRSVGQFDVQTFLRFMQNHGFLSWSTFQWLTPEEGAKAEIEALRLYITDRGGQIFTNKRAVRWDAQTHLLHFADGSEPMKFDKIVCAMGARQAKEFLGEIGAPLLRNVKTTSWRVVLHRDASLMPQDVRSWASWNVVKGGQLTTYWVNSIQGARVGQNGDSFISLFPKIQDSEEHEKNGSSSVASLFPARNLIEWEGDMEHPQMEHGTMEQRRRLLHQGLASDSIFVAGAWLRYGFHEDGALSGAWAARNLLGSAFGKSIGDTVPVYSVANDLQRISRPVWVSEDTRIMHASTQNSKHGFSYAVPEQVVLDLGSLPSYWWGGFNRSDHYGDDREELLHTMSDLVHRELGVFPAGPIHLVTTLRAFGQCMNPISLYVVWNVGEQCDLIGESAAPVAFVYEVHNYPWGEVYPYVIDARAGKLSDDKREFALEDVRFKKMLHVSPWHPHPAERAQHYETSIHMRLGKDGRPFQSMHMKLSLFYSDESKEKLFASSWNVENLTMRFPRPLPIALLTAGRILSEARHVQGGGRRMYANLTNADCPISTTTLFFSIFIFSFLLRFGGVGGKIASAIMCMLLATKGTGIPIARDILIGIFAVMMCSLII